MFLQFVVSGALVGLIVGATGVGGGSLMTPLLTLFFGIPAQVAVGTDLLFAALTKSSGAWAYARRGNVPWQIVQWMALGSVPASLLTLGALHVWRPDPVQFAQLVRPVLGFALVLTAVAITFRARIQALGARLARGASTTPALAGIEGAPEVSSVRARPAATLAIGAAVGILVTLTSVGAGAIGVVALFFLFPLLPARALVGADIVHAVPLTLVAGLGHAALGTVDWGMLIALLVGSVPAIQVGAALAHRVPEPHLRLALAAMLALVGARLISF